MLFMLSGYSTDNIFHFFKIHDYNGGSKHLIRIACLITIRNNFLFLRMCENHAGRGKWEPQTVQQKSLGVFNGHISDTAATLQILTYVWNFTRYIKQRSQNFLQWSIKKWILLAFFSTPSTRNEENQIWKQRPCRNSSRFSINTETELSPRSQTQGPSHCKCKHYSGLSKRSPND